MGKLCLLGLIAGSIAATGAIVGNSQALTVLAYGLVLASLEIAVLFKVAGGFTPAVLPIPVINGVLLTSVFLWDRVGAEAKYGVSLRVPEDLQLYAAVVGIVFCAAYTSGAVLAGPRHIHMSIERIGESLARFGQSFPIPCGPLVGVGYVGIVLTAFAWQGALVQGRYLEAHGPTWAVILSNAVTPLAVLALCLAAARPGRWRALAIIGVGLWFLVLFGRSTRNIAAMPAMIVLAMAVASGRRIRMRYLIIAAVATIALLQLVIFGRGNPGGVGLVPLGTQLFTAPQAILADFSFYGILGNVWISGPLTAVVAQRPIPTEALWISINPAPGVLAGWGEIQDSLRLNMYTPYNTLGELGSHGWTAVVFVAFVAGFGLSLSTRIASKMQGAYAMIAMVVVLAIVALFSVTVLQYNLRASMRLVWYALLGVAALWFAHAILRRSTNRILGPANPVKTEKLVRPLG